MYGHMKQFMLIPISGAIKVVHFMIKFTYLNLTRPHKPPGEQSHELRSLVPECLVEKEKKKRELSYFQEPLQAL